MIPEIEVRNLNFYYARGIHILKNINMTIYKNQVTALIGPSGCGKTTLLRCFNRMHALYAGNKYNGEIIFHISRAKYSIKRHRPYRTKKQNRYGISETYTLSYEYI